MEAGGDGHYIHYIQCPVCSCAGRHTLAVFHRAYNGSTVAGGAVAAPSLGSVLSHVATAQPAPHTTLHCLDSASQQLLLLQH